MKKFKHILRLSPEEKENFLNSFDHILSDCDGVLWHLMKPLPNIGPAINLLKKARKSYKYLTNNSVRSIETYMHMFNVVLDTETQPEDILHPAQNVINHLRHIGFEGLIYCIATALFKNHLRAAGFQVIDGPEEPVEESVSKIISLLNDVQPVMCVVVDMDFNLNYCKLTRAAMYLRDHPETLFITGATNQAILIDSVVFLGPGDMLQCLERLAKRKATVLGKPGQPLVELMRKEPRFKNPKRVLYIGDSLDQDMIFAHKCEFQKLLVLSGVTSKENLFDPGLSDDFRPDYYADSLADFIDFFKTNERV